MLWRMALLPAAIIFLSAIAIVGTNRLKQISPANRHDLTLLYVGAKTARRAGHGDVALEQPFALRRNSCAFPIAR